MAKKIKIKSATRQAKRRPVAGSMTVLQDVVPQDVSGSLTSTTIELRQTTLISGYDERILQLVIEFFRKRLGPDVGTDTDVRGDQTNNKWLAKLRPFNEQPWLKSVLIQPGDWLSVKTPRQIAMIVTYRMEKAGKL